MILNIVAEYFSYIAKKAHPRCKNFVILTSDIKKENREVKIIDPTPNNSYKTKKISQAFTLR